MNEFAAFFVTALATFVLAFILVPLALGLVRFFGLYTTVRERQAKVFTLFGKVVGTIEEPGLHILPFELGPQAFLIPWFGEIHVVDMRLDQVYLRSQAVNSEEGTPMGIGVWYEMFVSDPVAFRFNNADPRGSLQANVANATVRCLSNMPLSRLLEDRHSLSRIVRSEAGSKSSAWGFELGSVYIRKVHFRDAHMIRQIEQKVVNRLRQVTSAICQDGVNQVSVITSAAEREAAVEFARAAAIRPQLVGQTLSAIAQNPTLLTTLFDILEIEALSRSPADLVLVPAGQSRDFLIAHESGEPTSLARPAPASAPPKR